VTEIELFNSLATTLYLRERLIALVTLALFGLVLIAWIWYFFRR
jgi:hypothetical protein